MVAQHCNAILAGQSCLLAAGMHSLALMLTAYSCRETQHLNRTHAGVLQDVYGQEAYMRVHGGMGHVRSQLRQHSCHGMRSCCAICKVPSMQQGSVASLHHPAFRPCAQLPEYQMLHQA